MPEGDTIWRAAASLSRALQGRRVTRCESTLQSIENAALAGHTIDRVEARGKNLLIHFDDGRVLHTHMRMKGSWHIYKTGEKWIRRTEAARVILETEAYVAICWSAPVVKLLTERGALRSRELSDLGPDILRADFDAEEARRRLRLHPSMQVGEAILHQGALAGIGNVFKSEALFAVGQDPFAEVARLADDALDRLVAEARRMMLRNLGPGPRRTRGTLGPRHWVYVRAGQPCLRCGARVEMRRQGAAARSTYFCPRCQAPRA